MIIQTLSRKGGIHERKTVHVRRMNFHVMIEWNCTFSTRIQVLIYVFDTVYCKETIARYLLTTSFFINYNENSYSLDAMANNQLNIGEQYEDTNSESTTTLAGAQAKRYCFQLGS
jgi:hypothetical protein